MANGNTNPTPAQAVTPPPNPAMEGAMVIPLEQIHIDWTNNISRQFLDKEHMEKSLAAEFDSDKFKDFIRAIKVEGLINPLIVKPCDHKSGKPHCLVSGYRRSEALKRLGWKDAPCKINHYDSLHADRVNIMENEERKDTSTFQLASAATTMMRKYKLTSEDVAKQLGKQAGYLRLIVGFREKLAPEILRAWADRDPETKGPSYKATTIPLLTSYASIPAAKDQVANYRIQVLIADGATPEAAEKMVKEQGWVPPPPAQRGARSNKKQSVKVAAIRELKKSLKAATFKNEGPEAPHLRDAIVAALDFLCSKTATTIKVGKITLYDSRAEDKSDTDPDDND